MPSADEVLRIYRANQQQLSHLHVQLLYHDENTEAACRKAQQKADNRQKLLDHFSKTKIEDIELEVGGKKLRGEEARPWVEQLTGHEALREIKTLRSQAKPFHYDRPMELFTSGDDYQFRQPASTDVEGIAWTFPTAPLTAETLPTTYRDVSIFSRSARSNPAARWWSGSAHDLGCITQKHLCDVMHYNMPPFTWGMHPTWGEWHPFDHFFAQQAECYRVVRQEEIDGRLLTVVDADVPPATGTAPGFTLPGLARSRARCAAAAFVPEPVVRRGLRRIISIASNLGSPSPRTGCRSYPMEPSIPPTSCRKNGNTTRRHPSPRPKN